jgi:hypothetical protein
LHRETIRVVDVAADLSPEVARPLREHCVRLVETVSELLKCRGIRRGAQTSDDEHEASVVV